MQKKKRKKKKVGKLGIKIKFRAFGPLQENISQGPSPTREDTPFKKKIKERDEEISKHQPQPPPPVTDPPTTPLASPFRSTQFQVFKT